MKHILYCADGTWNGPGTAGAVDDIDASANTTGEGAPRSTNVWKLFVDLAGTVTSDTVALPSEQEKVFAGNDGAALQVAKYMHGVGDSSNLAIKALGGVFGAGVIVRMVRGYTLFRATTSQAMPYISWDFRAEHTRREPWQE